MDLDPIPTGLASNAEKEVEFALPPGLEIIEPLCAVFRRNLKEEGLKYTPERAAILERATTWIDSVRDDPFFAWFHFIDPHAPYVALEGSEHLYTPGYEGPFEKTTKGKFEAEDPIDQRRIRELYDGEILAADSIFESTDARRS